MEVKEIILKVVELGMYLLGMPLTQWLKVKLNLKDKWALVLAGTVALVLALVQVFVQGDLSLSSFTLEQFSASFGVIFAVAVYWYRLLMKEE